MTWVVRQAHHDGGGLGALAVVRQAHHDGGVKIFNCASASW